MIELRATEHVARFYDVLSKVDLGRDAANLYRRPTLWARLFSPTWPAPLARAYAAAPGRLLAQIVPLIVDDDAALRAWLAAPRGALSDEPGRLLCAHLLDALRFEQQWSRPARLPEVPTDVLEALDALHAELWRGAERCHVVVHHAPALQQGEFSHGRATVWRDRQVVAVAWTADPVLAAIQVLHETTHAVTDREVGASATRDTAVQSAGYADHMRLERAAVERGQELIDRVAPHWAGAYDRWRARYRL